MSIHIGIPILIGIQQGRYSDLHPIPNRIVEFSCMFANNYGYASFKFTSKKGIFSSDRWQSCPNYWKHTVHLSGS